VREGAVEGELTVPGETPAAATELWVCFELPAEPPPASVLLLSFIAPAAEHRLEQRCSARIVSGRVLVQQVRPRAREEYVRLIARIGATPVISGRTLRQSLRGPGGYSRWWFLDVTEKDCLWDEDTIYLSILQLMVVETVKAKHGIERVRLIGAPAAFAAALDKAGAASPESVVRAVVIGLLSRLKLAGESVRLWWNCRRVPARQPEHRDVLLQGYWDWTVSPGDGRSLRDHYFRQLPAQLTRRGVSVGWLASCEPRYEAWQQGRKLRDVVAAAAAYPAVTLLERYLTPADIFRSIFNPRYPIEVTRFVLNRRFQGLCAVGAFDLYPLIRQQLLRAAWGATWCRLQMVATATARACEELRPRLVLTCFELFLRSRAFYAGLRACSVPVKAWAAQHAGYSTDKTLGVFEPDSEIEGVPDGCPVPAPDGIFVMGELSRRIWEANGFSPDRVVVTGGLRYEAVGIETRAPSRPGGEMSILLVGGMSEAAHLDLCDAVVAAAAGLPGTRIYWRDHPKYLFSRRAAFQRYRSSITVTSRSLADDLKAADLVLFTQTGLGEEALLRGIPAWQWLWPGFNTSPFLDIPVVPSFTSVSTLRTALEEFVRNPVSYLPSAETQRRVLNECFGSAPSAASARIADAACVMMGRAVGTPA
jgi:surface carbohydrate biosynthesis protein (TIGR04326 family)